MSLNLGTPACQAIQNLRNSDQWPALMGGLAEIATARMHVALQSAPDMRVDNTAYARALHDIYVAFEAASRGVNAKQVKGLSASGVSAP